MTTIPLETWNQGAPIVLPAGSLEFNLWNNGAPVLGTSGAGTIEFSFYGASVIFSKFTANGSINQTGKTRRRVMMF